MMRSVNVLPVLLLYYNSPKESIVDKRRKYLSTRAISAMICQTLRQSKHLIHSIQFSLHVSVNGFSQRHRGSKSTSALKMCAHYLLYEPLPLLSLISVVCFMYVWWGTLECAKHIVFYSEEPPFPDKAFSTAVVSDPLMGRHGWKWGGRWTLGGVGGKRILQVDEGLMHTWGWL